MCGIVGYLGEKQASPILLNGLSRLEYRGYDSAGIAFLDSSGSKLLVVKERGKLEMLRQKLSRVEISSVMGIGHTRWATHGEPSRDNAHPHMDFKNKIAVVHNGIIENYAELKAGLLRAGAVFHSQTDTEVATNLIGHYYEKGRLFDAVHKAVQKLKGYFALVVMAADEPDKLVVFKRSNPLVIGLGKKENFVASDVSALLPYTRRVIYMEDNEFGILTKNSVQIFSPAKKPVRRRPSLIRWNPAQAQKGGFRHFMLKEIYEQPTVVEDILKLRIRHGRVVFDSIRPKIRKKFKGVKKIDLVSCGTAYHAGLVANYLLGECTSLPVEATVSSEFRYEQATVKKNDLVILISQSGETADTLAALRKARENGAITLAIVNVVGSTIAREADAVIYTHAGPEIGVASTKAYIAQLTVLSLFALYFSEIHPNKKRPVDVKKYLKELARLPAKVQQTLKQEAAIKRCAKKLHGKQTFIYLGRGFNYPNALEGALKLKEITYSHAHGYPAGEMKHGPIALIDSNQPVICLAPQTATYEKMVSNIEEIRARKGIVVSIATQGDRTIQKLSRHTFSVPPIEEMFSPILTVIPLQLFAYHVAVFKKRDVDQPRNLAKSVTVE